MNIREESQAQLEKLLYADLKDRRFKEMREYLDKVKSTFSGYDRWIKLIEQEGTKCQE